MLNLLSDAVRRDPFSLYDHARANAPVMRDPRSGLWMIFDYDGAKRALHDGEAFSSDLSTATGHPAPEWMIFMDPPRHTRLRGLIAKAFAPRMIAGLEARVAELSRGLLDAAVGRGEMELAADYAVPLPMTVIAEIIGVPAADWERYRRWSDAILRLSYTVRGISPPEESAAATAEYLWATNEMADYLPQLVADRRARPRDDLLTRLVEAEVDGQRLAPHELLAFVQLLLVGGQETTANLINNAILCLLEHPDEMARVRALPAALIPSAIEEVLRYRSPFQWVFRATRGDVQMQTGHTIPARQLVLVMLGSANRDPKQFANADRFDVTRDPNPHLAFGHGPHFCLGAALSRMEARVALTDLLTRLKDLRLASDEPWEPRKALHVHGPNRLPVRFTPA